eukprot:353586-Chlamydomonas_euryale.AAC.3
MVRAVPVWIDDPKVQRALYMSVLARQAASDGKDLRPEGAGCGRDGYKNPWGAGRGACGSSTPKMQRGCLELCNQRTRMQRGRPLSYSTNTHVNLNRAKFEHALAELPAPITSSPMQSLASPHIPEMSFLSSWLL